MSHVTLAQGVVRVMSSMFHVVLRFDSTSTLHSAPFTVSLIFYFILLIFPKSSSSSSSSVWVGSERSTRCASVNEEPDSFVNNVPLTTQAYWTVVLDLGDWGLWETVVVVLPHACFWAFLVLPCARILWLVCRVLKRRMMSTQHWSRVQSSELQRHWCMVGGAVKTDEEKGIM